MKHLLIAFVGALTLAGCASSQTASRPPAASTAPAPGPGMHGGGKMHGAMMAGGDMGKSCPMMVPGTTARSEEVEGGAAIVLTTTGDVAELRRRVAAMAEKHNKHQGQGCPMMAMHGAPAAAAPDAPAATPADHAAHHPQPAQP